MVESKASLNRKKRGSKKFTSTATRSEPAGHPESLNLKLCAVVGCCIFAAAAVTVLITVLVGRSLTGCERYLEETSSGKNVTVGLDPIAAGSCLRSNCKFDVARCSWPCPFGYKKDILNPYCPINCDCAVLGKFQGDVDFDEKELPELLMRYGHIGNEEDFSLFFGWGGQIWKNIEVDGRYKIPYVMDSALPEDLMGEFEKTIKNISERTCIDLIPRVDHTDYLDIMVTGGGCSSLIGRNSGGKRPVYLNQYGCFFEATMQHELMHAFGFHHEQTREDRDSYVDIFWDNIQPNVERNFAKQVGDQWIDLKAEYELHSGMHYLSRSFQIDRFKPTIVGKGNYIIEAPPRGHFLTAGDFSELRLLYSCQEKDEGNGEWGEWDSWSECGQTCGSGKKIRFRKCMVDGSAKESSSMCEGVPSGIEECNTEKCPPQTGEFSEWGEWAECSKSCDKGSRMRSRKCSEKRQCEGDLVQYGSCYVTLCDTGKVVKDSQFGTWSPWAISETCTKTCGTGKQTSARQCMHKDDRLEATRCPKDKNELLVNERGDIKIGQCNTKSCSDSSSSAGYTTTSRPTGVPSSDEPTWSEWTLYDQCSRSCGGGRDVRNRDCYLNGGIVKSTRCKITKVVGYLNVEGDQVRRDCNSQSCDGPQPVTDSPSGGFNYKLNLKPPYNWTPWGECAKTCGHTVKERQRKCERVERCISGVRYEMEYCALEPCASEGSPPSEDGDNGGSESDGGGTTGDDSDGSVPDGGGTNEGNSGGSEPDGGSTTGDDSGGSTSGGGGTTGDDSGGSTSGGGGTTGDYSGGSASDGDKSGGSVSEGGSETDLSTDGSPPDGGSAGSDSNGDGESGSNTGDPTGDGTDAFSGSSSAGMFKGTPVNKLSRVCTYGYIVVGYFNEDEIPDLVCVYEDGFLRTFVTDSQKGILGRKMSFEGPGICRYGVFWKASNFFAADMNGDGLDDITCLCYLTSELITLFNLGDGAFDPLKASRASQKDCGYLSRIVDINKDGYPDMICGKTSKTPIEYIYYGEANTGQDITSPNVSPGNSTSPGV